MESHFSERGQKRNYHWQEEYFAISVSESIIERVRHYIKNQEEHHRKKTFKDEYDELVEKFGFFKEEEN